MTYIVIAKVFHDVVLDERTGSPAIYGKGAVAIEVV